MRCADAVSDSGHPGPVRLIEESLGAYSGLYISLTDKDWMWGLNHASYPRLFFEVRRWVFS